MKKRINLNKIKSLINKDTLLIAIFIITNIINSILLKLITVKGPIKFASIMVEIGFLLLLGSLSLLFKKEKRRAKYLFIISIIMTIICTANSLYYHYYSSFTSISLLATAVFVKDVSDAVFENVLKPVDLVYLWQPIFFYIYMKKNNNKLLPNKNKKNILVINLIAILFLSIGSLFMPSNAWSRFYKLWNRESVVINFGPYLYQLDDIIQSLTPRISTIFGHDNALRKVREYYEEQEYKESKNEYSNIFAGKNVIVIHAESMQGFAMNLSFNAKEVTPNLNKLAKEGIFFNNFYSEVGVGTSSDAEFTFNTSLMPSTIRGTVFVNYFDRKYIAIPELLKEKGYYTYSMHANNGDFWNRSTMHKTLGYDKFYSKEFYNIDETIGLGLSDKSFFSQSVNIMKKVKEEQKVPFYSLLIMLSNHTPFSDLELMDEYPTTIDVEVDNQKITRDYLNGTKLGNYLRSVHYADQAIGEFINKLDKEGLLENTVLVIYGDHDARLDYDDFNLLYNYDPINDLIRTKEDEGYKVFNDYEYELNRKVPFIIWTKDKQYNKTINTPTGMIDVLPTLGNMLGIHSKYQLGNDIMNITDGDNMVVFTDGSFVTSKIYYSAPKSEIYPLNNDSMTEEYINLRVNHSSELIDVSNDIIYYDLIKELETK